VREALKERPVPGLPTLEKMVKVPIEVEVATADMLSCTDGSCANEVEPWPMNVPNGDASAPERLDVKYCRLRGQ
jgi:hypothetical protein